MVIRKAIAVVDNSHAAPVRGARLLERLRANPPRSSPPLSLSWDAHGHPNGLTDDLLSYWLVFLHCGLGAPEFRTTMLSAQKALQECRADDLPLFVCYSGGDIDPLVDEPLQLLDTCRHSLIRTRMILLEGDARHPSEWRLVPFIEAAAARYPDVDDRLFFTLYTGEPTSPPERPDATSATVRTVTHGLRNLLVDVQRLVRSMLRGSNQVESEEYFAEVQPCLRYLEKFATDARRLPVTETVEGIPIASALEVLVRTLGGSEGGEPNLHAVQAQVDALLSWCENGRRRFGGYE